MPKLLESIAQRRSVRTFTEKPVGEDMIRSLLEAGMCAPSAGNQRPWHFVVLQDRERITRIPEFHPYSSCLLKCPLVIAVMADVESERFPGNWPLDCAAAAENMLLQAQSLHLGAVWLGIYPEEERMEELEKLLGVPSHVKAFGIVAVGHPAQKMALREEDRFDLSRVHHERWSS